MSVTSTQSGLQSIRQIWALAGEHRAALTYSIGYRFAQSLALGMAYAAMLWMIVGLVNGRAMTFGWAAQITGLMAMSFVLQLLLSFLSVRLAWTASYDVVANLRLKLLDHARALPLGFHLSRHKGDTISLITSDMQMIEGFLTEALPRIA